jgi:predicted CXXCH cytochrome family protein
MLFAVVGLFGATAAHAWPESMGEPWGIQYNPGCDGCHPGGDTSGANPHGGYTNTTDRCRACHDVHEAAYEFHLLRGRTILEVCNSCHDLSFTSSGGRGVYGVIRARGQVVRSRHDIDGYNNTETAPGDGSKSYEATSMIPGAQASLIETLSCISCHSPHESTVISPYLGERIRLSAFFWPPAVGTKLLRDDVGAAPDGTYGVYGADWCAGCHDRRHSGAKGYSGINNHPVDQLGLEYGETSAAAGSSWWTFVSADATLPAHQAGWSREATSGWKPMCQQCHEDRRDVERAYQLTTPDFGTVDGDPIQNDNPQFATFPHENDTESFLVESGDDLCLNCHSTSGLP